MYALLVVEYPTIDIVGNLVSAAEDRQEVVLEGLNCPFSLVPFVIVWWD